MFLLIIAGSVWLFCILYNAYWFFKCISLYRRFQNGKDVTSHISDIDELFHAANTSYPTIYDENKDGYVQRTTKDVAYLSDKKKYYNEVNKVFLISKGVFRKRLIRSIFPINFLFLPSYILKRKDISAPVILHAFLTVLYWLVDLFLAYNLNMALDLLYQSRALEWFRMLLEGIA